MVVRESNDLRVAVNWIVSDVGITWMKPFLRLLSDDRRSNTYNRQDRYNEQSGS